MCKKAAKGEKEFNLKVYLERFGTNEKCLAYLARLRWPEGIHCETCERITRHHLIAERKCYSCQHCGTQVRPTAGTIFENSKVPLPDWFYVAFLFSKTKTGIPAKQIERELGISYPTALRICNTIRGCMNEGLDPFTGTVEVDETYIGGKPRGPRGKAKRGRGTKKTPVFGVLERGGAVKAQVVANVKRDTLFPIIEEAVAKGAEVYTDEFVVYDTLPEKGYNHDRVRHKEKEYVRFREDGARVHTNALEGFWSYPKSAVQHVHRGVSKRHLQKYLDEYTFRYTHRNDEAPMFFTILQNAVRATPL